MKVKEALLTVEMSVIPEKLMMFPFWMHDDATLASLITNWQVLTEDKVKAEFVLGKVMLTLVFPLKEKSVLLFELRTML